MRLPTPLRLPLCRYNPGHSTGTNPRSPHKTHKSRKTRQPHSPHKAHKTHIALTTISAAADLLADLTPALRMRKRRRLPKKMNAGILGAEIATWWALSPSLLLHPWWATAANLTFAQGVGHLIGTTISWISQRSGLHPPEVSRAKVHGVLGLITLSSAALYLRRGQEQAALLGTRARGVRPAATGVAVGTAGYAAMLLAGELTQRGTQGAEAVLRAALPPRLSYAGALLTVGTAWMLLWDRLFFHRLIRGLSRRAEILNRAIPPFAHRPSEPQRSGSSQSLEPWGYLGAQGRINVSSGPRAADIRAVTGNTHATEPIRVFIGLVPGRSLEQAAQAAVAELERTGAFSREVIVITHPSGTGWLPDYSLDAVEFLTGGNCATVAMQYTYLPSAVSYYQDRSTALISARLLVRAVVKRAARSPRPPRIFLSGESLGAYGMAGVFDSLAELRRHVDGALFSGPPRSTPLTAWLRRQRQVGSPERLSLLNDGRHLRVCAHPGHLSYDHSGQPYRQSWQHPRVVVAQHASDPIVWWEPSLFYRRPDWLREPGSRGVRAPAAHHSDVVRRMRWVPLITGWQVGVDMLTCTRAPGNHGHNYHSEFAAYWAGILGVEASRELLHRCAQWTRRNGKRRV
ncbi:alpha/beta-hydrolase family protein [Corynebacterium lowii]|uniref:Alpha/beta-hydrolase family protein n=1 Tax=Corynebacterium lowii TaxID=1544413 RepID=A0A0Q0YBP6_9CORY|nr:alpha/beta-hydrolase family protein [Corynebacterium lowii]KQB83436.1 hypothetical protein Clow_02239 [Corynebacterium lowii]MDP9852479.1 putative membrane protein [Corynebacterium lowii]